MIVNTYEPDNIVKTVDITATKWCIIKDKQSV